MNKPRIVKDYEKLSEDIQHRVKLTYPYGFEKELIIFKNAQGKFVSALPYETEEFFYLIRMTRVEAQEIIQEDDDFNEDGILKDKMKDKFTDEEEE